MEVAGATVLRNTSRAEKSVWVSSLLLGPRSRVLGGLDCISEGSVVCRYRQCVRGEGACDEVVVGAIDCRGIGLVDCERVRVRRIIFLLRRSMA